MMTSPKIAVVSGEDDADNVNGGETIDTFSLYRPTSLPSSLIHALSVSHGITVTDHKSDARSTDARTTQKNNNVDSCHTSSATVLLENHDSDDTNQQFKTKTDWKNNTKADTGKQSNDVNDEECGNGMDKTMISKKIKAIKNENAAESSEGKSHAPPKCMNYQTLVRTLPASIESHSYPACESGLLASVSSPRIHDSLEKECSRFLIDLAVNKSLSPLQLESVSLAIQRHNRLLLEQTSNNDYTTPPIMSSSIITKRAGFFIGDGAGVGKGRQIAAILRDSLCRNRTRHLWISVSRDLIVDARRDLVDVGCHGVEVFDGSDLLDQTGGSGCSSNGGSIGRGKKRKGLGMGGGLGKGVLFVTYALLVSGQGKRMEEIIHWLEGGGGDASTIGKRQAKNTFDSSTQKCDQQEQSFSGLIIFDEAHKAKNMEANTQTAKLVISLQNRLPHARILYCSATGVSGIPHMVYATRLGLWGAGNPLYPTFESFRTTMTDRGVGAMELLALEMKRMGSFVARTLSWTGAGFDTLTISLDAHQTTVYDRSVKWWRDVKQDIETVFGTILIQQQGPPKQIWRNYWSAHQRFFKELSICAKIPLVANEAKRLLETGEYAVIIGLQSTGESGTLSALSSSMNEKNSRMPSLLCTVSSSMISFLDNHYPIALSPPKPIIVPPMPSNGFSNEYERERHLRLLAEAERVEKLPAMPTIPGLVRRRDLWRKRVGELGLPPNPLDDLIDRLGGIDKVSEMTGRSGRVIRCSNNREYSYVSRGPKTTPSYGLSSFNSDDLERSNLVEKAKFMKGEKSVAIISDAASTGISLHAARGSGSEHKRRVHFTIELPWAADKAIQQLGRSHRSNQTSAPIYKLVVTNLGGERRFAAAISKRMAMLGALTKGDRRAASGFSDLSEFDLDSTFGKRALKRLYASLEGHGSAGRECDENTHYVAPSQGMNCVLDEFVQTANEEELKVLRKMDGGLNKWLLHENKDSTRTLTAPSARLLVLMLANQGLDDVGLTGNSNNSSSVVSSNKQSAEVKTFLNRIAGLEVRKQNLLFQLFSSSLADIISDAKATGTFESSVEDVKATQITLHSSPEEIATDISSGTKTFLSRIVLDRGVSFEDAIAVCLKGLDRKNQNNNDNKTLVSQHVNEGKKMSVPKRAESGFYASKRLISGRYLVLLAQRKMEPSLSSLDPLGLMVLTRPNTGKNPCEMSSRDLKMKYRLLVSVEDMQLTHTKIADVNKSNSSGSSNVLLKESNDNSSKVRPYISKICNMQTKHILSPAIDELRETCRELSNLWDKSYNESDQFDRHASGGLAPRRSALGLITGATLHIMPALEKAVVMKLRIADRALKVIRVTLSDSGQKIVGIRFPIDNGEESVLKLKHILKELKDVRHANGSFGTTASFIDEKFAPPSERALSWCTTKKKTLQSFFAVKSPSPYVKTPYNADICSNASNTIINKTSFNKKNSNVVESETKDDHLSVHYLMKVDKRKQQQMWDLITKKDSEVPKYAHKDKKIRKADSPSISSFFSRKNYKK